MSPVETRVGVISDTHGLLRPEAVAALRGSQIIMHAGDVGAPHVLEHLRALAPTFAVRGNIDTAGVGSEACRRPRSWRSAGCSSGCSTTLPSSTSILSRPGSRP